MVSLILIELLNSSSFITLDYFFYKSLSIKFDIQEFNERISSKTLAMCLRELVSNRILNRQFYYEIPPLVEYRLTSKKQELRIPSYIY
jgi:hypothetical protein